jgi:hypothetical protein
MTSSEMIMLALSKCHKLDTMTADDVLGVFLHKDAKDLEELAGTPSTVFNAQYAAWLKRNFVLAKCLESDRETFDKMASLIQRLPDVNVKPPVEVTRQRVRADISRPQAVSA